MDILAFLSGHGIAFEKHEHPAVFTCEESEALNLKLPGVDTKNLFLRDKKETQYFLVVVNHKKSVDLKALSALLGVKNLSFGSAEKLKEFLGVDPGSATLLGVAVDTGNKVHVIIDKPVWDADAMQCHPLRNTATLVIPHSGVEAFLKAVQHEARVMDLPARA